jgi:hypothetical protein
MERILIANIRLTSASFMLVSNKVLMAPRAVASCVNTLAEVPNPADSTAIH